MSEQEPKLDAASARAAWDRAAVTGIDLSPRMIEHARRREAESPLGVEYRALDAAEIATAFPAGSFDMARASWMGEA